MSKSLPVLSCRDVVKRLRRLGFDDVRRVGSHEQFRHPGGRTTTVPDHGGRDLSPALLRKIAADIGPTAQQLVAA